jgi:diguanylate cyclase (GGDEF)-like protein
VAELLLASVALVCFAGALVFGFVMVRRRNRGANRRVRVEEHRVRELERLAMRDPLTGAHNRRYFDEALRGEIHRYRRYDRPVSVVLFDVDDLKAINDRGGHAAGDLALINIASAAEDVVRASDSVVRLGGDEFAVLLPETDQPRALIVAERVRETIGKLPIEVAGGTSISVGVASLPRDGQTAEELQAKADQALYWVKKHGKNRCATVGSMIAGASGFSAYAASAI